MKRILILCGFLIGGDLLAEKVICVSQIIKHPALDRTYAGILDALATRGYKEGVNLKIVYNTAQGDIKIAQQIAAKFIAKQPDVVVALGTISAQSLMKYSKTRGMPLVFSSVTDPKSAGLQGKKNISGVSNDVSLENQIEFYQRIMPELKSIGLLYNPSEANSVSVMKCLKTVCQNKGIVLRPQAMLKTSEVNMAVAKLVGQVDALLIHNDNTALSAISTISAIAKRYGKPVFVSDTDAVKQGATAAFGPNQYAIGIQTGNMVASVLDGEDINDIPIQYPNDMSESFNTTQMEKLNLIANASTQ